MRSTPLKFEKNSGLKSVTEIGASGRIENRDQPHVYGIGLAGVDHPLPLGAGDESASGAEGAAGVKAGADVGAEAAVPAAGAMPGVDSAPVGSGGAASIFALPVTMCASDPNK